MLRTYTWKSAGLRTGLALALLLGVQTAAPGESGPARGIAAAAAADEVYIPTVDWAADPGAKDGSIIRQGRLLVPVRLAAAQLQLGLYADAGTNAVKLLGIDRDIVLKPGVKTAFVNGKQVELDAAPTIVNGSLYVPFRFVADAFGFPIVRQDARYAMRVTNLYVRGQLGSETYWMNRGSGELYYSDGTFGPKRIGQLKMRIYDLGGTGFRVDKVGGRTIRLSMFDSYGEPHLHDVAYQALLQGNRLLIESKVDYYGMHNHANVETYQGDLVLIDGSVAKLVDPATGAVEHTYDLAALTGGKPEDSYVLEYISDDMLLIRPYQSSLLTAVDPETKQATVLYKELLPEETRKMLEDWPLGPDYPGDDLRFVKRTGDTFEFAWTDRMNGGKVTTYQWVRPR